MLDDDEEDEEDLNPNKDKSVILQARTRNLNNAAGPENDENRKTHQTELLISKMEDVKSRYDKGEIKNVKKKEVLKMLNELNSYNSVSNLPVELIPGKLYVDKAKDSILIPINSSMVPFHASIIKNISMNQEGNWTNLRINFHIPSSSNNMSAGL